IMRYTNSLGFAEGDRMSLVQNPSFSGTMSTIFGALLNGATLVPRCLYPARTDSTDSSLGEWLERESVTVFHAVPSIFRTLPMRDNRYPSMRLIRLEGDRSTAADLEHFNRTFNERCVLVNGLGATECGLVRQYFLHSQSPGPASAVLPVGYAVEDVVIELLDDHGQPVEPGKPGEIIIKSEWLACGYWRDQALTDQRFTIDQSGQRQYRTGDLGQLTPDGCLTVHGRMDALVRIRGQFVDTACVETVMTNIAGVQHSLARAVPNGQGEERLIAWIVPDEGASLTASAIRQLVREELPAVSVPSAVLFIDKLPLTVDGKLDVRKLPAPGTQRPPLGTLYAPPETPLQRQISDIWGRILGIDYIGLDDSFIDLGGDSLHAMRIADQLSSTLHTALSVVDLFEQPSVRLLAASLEKAGKTQGDRRRRSPGTEAPQIEETTASNVRATPGNGDWPEHAIAVIGMAGRFPGASTVTQLWNNLARAKESITRFDETAADRGQEDRWVDAYGVLDDIDQFDADFFGLTPREARDLDPQQRIWLECVLHALEDAGWRVNENSVRSVQSQLKEQSIGVFAGARDSTYLWEILGTSTPGKPTELSSDALALLKLGNDRDTLALRTSYLFGLSGPSINIQSTCSTSLVAVAQACQSLTSGLCDVAIAGGACITFPQLRTPGVSARGIRSRDGYCRAFDADATGTVFGDGVGVVVLKRIGDALADGNRIDALIRGWSINNDGAHKASFAAPNGHAQTQVVKQAHRHAEIHPRSIGYVEAHGTATPVGDPIEFAALQRVFNELGDSPATCGIGSIKGNIGHLDAAAGVAGLIKTVLALRHGEIPASLHFSKPNPTILYEDSHLRVIDSLQPWPDVDGPRMAGVSSFGVGGTNCHLVLQHVEVASPPSTELSGADTRTCRNRSANVGYVFTGQGCLYPGMANKLFTTEPAFRQALKLCDTLLQDQLEVPLSTVMFDTQDEQNLLDRADFAHAALFAVQYALCRLL
ncbi:MAG: AMP-binding protein, partial [Granulosicoccus sp.]|nr:AMP-binding protein [Granulosicoccus sp.]